jgi:hypothetical protein
MIRKNIRTIPNPRDTQTIIYETLQITKDEATRTPLKMRVHSGSPEGLAIPVLLVVVIDVRVIYLISLAQPAGAFLLFPFTIVLSALRFTDFDYPFGIFKLFLGNVRLCASQLKDNWQQHQINNIVRGGSMWPPVARQTTFPLRKRKKFLFHM